MALLFHTKIEQTGYLVVITNYKLFMTVKGNRECIDHRVALVWCNMLLSILTYFCLSCREMHSLMQLKKKTNYKLEDMEL